MENKIVIYTDGGCYNYGDRKGDGSYAFLIKTDNTEYVDVYCGYIENTTNNRTEIMAVIESIKYISELYKDQHQNITIVSDSGYLIKGWTDPAYLSRWVANGWKTSTNTPVQNRDLWMELQRLSWHNGFNFIHIRGHNKDTNKTHAFWNDICDRACTHMIHEMPYPGFIVTLRYNFEFKTFQTINTQLIERNDGTDGEL